MSAENLVRVLTVVLDSAGCGHAPDAAEFGDAGADTLGHLFARMPDLELPALAGVGLYHVLSSLDPGFDRRLPDLWPGASWSRLVEHSAGKDTTTGHWELMGATLDEPFAVFERFPDDLVNQLEAACHCRFLGNQAASGTEIIARLGDEHVRTGRPILYTSADSVLQIAAHEAPEIFGLERLQDCCLRARRLLDAEGIRVGRVIARPFVGDSAERFQRTPNRHDYSLTPPETVLDRLHRDHVETIGVGKISDIFAGSGIAESHATGSNREGMETIDRLWAESRPHPHLIFANLVDFDSLYGHRRDPGGYAACLREFDAWLAGFLPKVGEHDRLLITADHGNDPYHHGTDHTREQVPLCAVNARLPEGVPQDFRLVSGLVETAFRG